VACGMGKLQGASECSQPQEDATSGRRGLARTPRRRYGARAGAPAHWSVGGVAACLKMSDWQHLTDINSNRKVVDLTTVYNFYICSRVFFSADFA
jgi:hypothetical protein